MIALGSEMVAKIFDLLCQARDYLLVQPFTKSNKMRRVSEDVPRVNPILNASCDGIGGAKIHGDLPDPRGHQLFPCMLETRFAGFDKSGSQIQTEVKLDPGDLPLFIVRQARRQPVWIETKF